MTDDKLSRRQLLQRAIAGLAAVPKKVDPKANPNFKPGQNCANCMQFTGKPGAAAGPCNIFPGKDVAAAGWCKVWVMKPGAKVG